MKKDNQHILVDNNLKITTGRLAVLDVLSRSHGPVAIETIKADPALDINPTTIYRILEIFVQKGIVYQTDFRDGKAYFELQRHHHHHVVCTNCGIKEDIALCIEKQIPHATRNLKKFDTIQSHMLEFFSICRTCKK
jgi:Fur family ferric uptake transcriptional regulator